MTKLGILSDTHGLLRPEVLHLLSSVNLIIHAGDIGSDEVLRKLKEIAPVTAVKGNVDTGRWASNLPEYAGVQINGLRALVTHKVTEVDQYARSYPADVVIFGHSHRPLLTTSAGQIRINPGSAGRKRFSLPVSLVLVDLSSGSFSPTFVDLETGQLLVPHREDRGASSIMTR